MNTRKKHQSSSFVSTLGKSFYSNQITPGGSPRACALGLPGTADILNENGFVKKFSKKQRDKEATSTIHAMTKCLGASPSVAMAMSGSPSAKLSKTEELLDFLRMNDRILRFKQRTVRNIEEIT
jgi:hypothetical protein